MLDILLATIFSTDGTPVTTMQFLACAGVSLVLGILCALVYMFRHHYHKNFVVTLALLPLVVQLIITLVNGNLGAGIAVMGAFNLVRFRSAPGSAKDIGSIFCAMAIGLATGMGYLGAACIFLVCFAAADMALLATPFGDGCQCEKQLKITIPEDLDYTEIFDDLFARYTRQHSLQQVRTTNLGSLFELTYIIKLKSEAEEKQFLDEIRCRNGNLKIICGRLPINGEVM